MIPFRTQVKFFLSNPQGAKLSTFSSLFQRWIQQQALEGMLIDVADYAHVFEGPGVVLIGHEADYAIENKGSRLGLLCTRKRQPDPDLPAQLRTTIRLALMACALLETESSFRPRLKFRTDEIEIRFADRLRLPNRPETFDLVKDDVRGVLTELYGLYDGTEALDLAPASVDPRHLFTLSVHHQTSAGVSDLLQQLKSGVQK
jgi:hypothetical protein